QLCTYFLGPFQLTRDGVSVTGFESDKMRALLAYLLVERDRPHRRDALAALLWPDQTDGEARHSLRQTLYVLRRILSSAGADRDPREPDENDLGPLLVTRQTVQVNPASDAWCDVAVFTRLLADCQAHQHRSGHPDHCAECNGRFHQAATLYRGDFLQGFLVTDTGAFEEWLLLERETHHRQMMRALERLADYYEEVGEHEQSLHFALWQLKLEPWREEAHRQAMRLLSRTGQRSAALAQYEACRRTLAAELGLEPARETTALYERIRDAAHEVLLEMPLEGMSFLPAAATPLIGREAEVTAVGERLLRDEVRLLTVTGPGGVGKTRVALQAAAGVQEHFAHGACFVDLAPLTDPGLVATAIATALGIKEQRVQGVSDGIAAYLANKQVLLLLDNFEQVGAAAPQVSRLLAACPGLKVLVTSRVPLGVRGEREYPVPPLSLPDLRQLPPLERLSQYEAMRLFVERATDVRPDFRLTVGNARAVAEICVRLDGLPLAIELAAARVRMLPPPLLLARLSRRLSLLTGGARDAPARQQTMRSTIAWSYDLLDVGEQQLFRRMAPFNGGRSLDALEAVCNWDGRLGIDVFEGAEALLSKNLLRQAAGRAGEPRFWMLETIHEYAREKLAESGEAAVLAGEHARYFLRLAEEAEPHLTGKEQQAWLDRLEDEYENIRAVLGWAGEAATSHAAKAAEVGLRLAAALYRYWHTKGLYTEGRDYLQKALSAWAAVEGSELGQGHQEPAVVADAGVGAAMIRVKAKALNGAGSLAERQGDKAAARPALEAALALGQEAGDRSSVAASLNHLATLAFGGADYSAARALFEESLALQRELGNHWGAANALNGLGIVALEQGDFFAARALLEESLALRRDLGDKIGLSTGLHNLGFVAKQLSDYATARAHYEESLALRREFGDRPGIAMSLHNMAVVAKEQGEYARARALYEESLALRREFGDKRSIGLSLHQLAVVAMEEGEAALARSLFDEALALLREVGDKQTVAWCLAFLGGVAHDEGDYALAATLYEEGLAGNREVGSKLGMAWPTGRLGLLAMERGDYARAQALLAESLAQAAEMGNRKGVLAALAGLGGLAARESRGERAAMLLGAVGRLVQGLGAVLDRVDGRTYEQSVAQARALLDEGTFARAWAAGQALSLAASVEYALHK
ncbi:MAG TPA: tetratricopeptide repeat protein, partial [Chloroflexia bacterium]|nr:tetratricopeptide repeat protein [Chloroflexia bacterium]